MLIFDDKSHTYFWDGVEVPGVTSILSPLIDFSRVPPAVLQAAADFGTAVHLACELDDVGDLDESTLDAALIPYLDAWRAFCVDHDVNWDVIEQPVYHSSLRYAGTPDRIGYVRGSKCVVDIKSTAQLYPSVGPQLSAYAYAYDAGMAPTMQRIAVQLKADGTYKAQQYKDPTDWPTFCSLLTIRNWCAKHNIKPNYKD